MTLALAQPPEPSPFSVPSTAELRAIRGRTEPRNWTRPLRELRPAVIEVDDDGNVTVIEEATSYGFDVIAFARDVLGEPLDPWEEWAVIHGGELLEDGRPRFRKLLILVARQNGKTHLLVVLTLFWLFVDEWSFLLGTSTTLSTARDSWQKAVNRAEGIPELRALMPPNGVRRGAIDTALLGPGGTPPGTARYEIAAKNRKAGRSKSIDRLVMDELREHQHWEAWDAAIPAMNARPYAQAWLLSNQGDDKSVVLNSLYDSCLAFIRTGQGDERFGLFDWSAPRGCHLLDLDAWAQANPNLNVPGRILAEDFLGDALRALEKGGEVETTFRTENLCQRVPKMDGAIDPNAWERDYVPGDLLQVKSRVALCLDISPDRMHATLAGAAVLEDGRVRVQVIDMWQGTHAVRQLREQLRGIVLRNRPQVIGWMPVGPAAVFAADMAEKKGPSAWPPPGVKIEAIRSEVSAVCMGFAEQVESGAVVHGNEVLLNDHVIGAEKLWHGDTWVFSRRGEGHCDAAYAAAGAVHLARTLPPPLEKRKLIVASTVE